MSVLGFARLKLFRASRRIEFVKPFAKVDKKMMKPG
jgi:hypothetical protein